MSNCKAALSSGSSALSQLPTCLPVIFSGAVTYFPLMIIYRDLPHATERGKIVLKVRLGGKVQMSCVQSSTPHHDLHLRQWGQCYPT